MTAEDTSRIAKAINLLYLVEDIIRECRAVAGRAITLDVIDKARLHCKALGHDIAREERGE